MTEHKCKGCEYLYIWEKHKQIHYYNALADIEDVALIKKNVWCCGYSPGGVELDDNAPRCPNFLEKKEEV